MQCPSVIFIRLRASCCSPGARVAGPTEIMSELTDPQALQSAGIDTQSYGRDRQG